MSGDWRRIFMPPRVAALPRNAAGYPIPYFAATIKGKREFRLGARHAYIMCTIHRRCWVCGERRVPGQDAFVIGPMCVINRTTQDPPSHIECAEYSVQVCPFLITPGMVRRDRGLPDDITHAGIPIMRNPGVSLIWLTAQWSSYEPPIGQGRLFELGEPMSTSWWKQGREATRAEVLESIASGLPLLQEMCEGEKDLQDLQAAHDSAMKYLPD